VRAAPAVVAEAKEPEPVVTQPSAKSSQPSAAMNDNDSKGFDSKGLLDAENITAASERGKSRG
jgi:hypothetical protein